MTSDNFENMVEIINYYFEIVILSKRCQVNNIEPQHCSYSVIAVSQIFSLRCNIL